MSKSLGNVVETGTTTTNWYYGTFSYVWTPKIEGKYTVTASFAADDSYGSSSAATVVSVGPALAEPPAQEPQQAIPDYTILFAGIIAAIVIAIRIGVVNLAVHFRKHQ
ncbi:MAG TPA: Ig-like domain-containing protein [Candidatus Bathyarchaeia archaeon]|nr:Ig-like domain-containing protein [Candidatus Bathyarchaeia archaeon]